MNVIKGEKIKWEGLTVQSEFMCNIVTKVMPIITRANRIISNSFRNYRNKTTGNHEIKALQKTTILALRT